MSRRFYEALGPEGSKRAFVHYPAGTLPRAGGRAQGRHALQRVRRLRTGSGGRRGHQVRRSRPGVAVGRRRRALRSRAARPARRPGRSRRARLRRPGGDAAVTSPPAPARPTLLLVGDSTVQTPTTGQLGWGTAIAHYFDASKIRVVNRALGGRSSRTFQTEGHLGPGAGRDQGRRLRAHPVRPQRRRLAQHRPGTRLAARRRRRQRRTSSWRRPGARRPCTASGGTCASTSPTRARRARRRSCVRSCRGTTGRTAASSGPPTTTSRGRGPSRRQPAFR